MYYSSGDWKPEIRVPAWSGESPLLVGHRFLTEEAREPTQASLIRVLILLMRAEPSRHTHLSKGPSTDSITLGIRI